MKAKLAGLGLLLVVILCSVFYMTQRSHSVTTTIAGYVGGEKIGLLEDEEVQKILKNQYQITIDYAKAGSLDMVREDHAEKDFLFPSSQTALELYQQLYGKPEKSEIIFNTPIVLYTYQTVADALIQQNIVTKTEEIYQVDMIKLTEAIEADRPWADLGVSQLYGNISVGTTDPNKSNSGNMFAGLLADTLCGGTATTENIDSILPRLKQVFQKLGYMETSSSDLFDQFLKTGMGAKPLIAGYENQLLEFAAENPETWSKIKDQIVMLYPNPTVWSSHVYIALDAAGKTGIEALQDSKIQKIAWEKHGFRTGVSASTVDTTLFGVEGLAQSINSVTVMPDVKTMEKIMDALA